MARPRFSGIYLPLATPFHGDGSIDDGGLCQLVDYLIGEGATGLVPCGTTGESATLSHDEHRHVVEVVVEHTARRVPVIAGTGSNSTAEAIELTRHAQQVGADAVLVICPYYNRPTQQGLLAHFRKIADATELPVIIYNIPKRTGVNMEAATALQLAKVPNIVGTKEGSGDLEQIMEIIAGADEFSVLSGDDHLLLPICALGGTGGIAAAAHFATGEWVRLYEAVESGRLVDARKIHYRLLPLVRAVFYETNPIPVKAGLELLGLPAGPPRLPLLPATEKCRELLRAVFEKLGLLP
jgi:4-hydroxy-tetrahydrodipicolinate synthase